MARNVSVTIDTTVLDELHQQEGASLNGSAVVYDALRQRAEQQRLLAVLNNMEREDLSTPAERAAGKKQWARIVSSSTPAPSRRSPAIKRSVAS